MGHGIVFVRPIEYAVSFRDQGVSGEQLIHRAAERFFLRPLFCDRFGDGDIPALAQVVVDLV